MKNENQPIIRGTILNVPFAEKDQAKQLGARWDMQLKKWFVPKGNDTKPFERWINEENSQEDN